MPQEGLEPPRAYAHYVLNVARLPIPPLRHKLFLCENNTTLAYRMSNHAARTKRFTCHSVDGHTATGGYSVT